MSPDDGLRELRDLPFRSLGFAHADTHRHMRTGFPEVVFCSGKSAAQIATLLAMAAARPRTRVEFLAISGVGPKKLASYGDVFLAALAPGRRGHRY